MQSGNRAVCGLSGTIVVAAAVAFATLSSVFVGTPVGAAQAGKPDPEDVAEGMRLYRTKADCQTCHGWAADGRKMDTQMPDAPSLRTTRLGRAGVIFAMKCGRPGRGMPAFDRLAYTDATRCNGTTLDDLKKNGQALTDLLHRLSRLGEELREVAELDLNPVIASPGGCVAVDALALGY